MTNTNDDYKTVEVVYLGKRLLDSKGEIADAYLPMDTFNQITIDERQLLDRMLSLFTGKTKVPLIIGGIYVIEAKVVSDRLTNMMAGSQKYQRRVDSNDPRLVEWAVANEAAVIEKKRLAMAVKLKKQNLIEAELKALQSIYKKLRYQDKLAFELMVLQYIRRG